ncbi:MAG: site-specific integrase [Acidobacteriota bacterium]|nr:site-specific integrase [Acidobacteriota bacterium]
MTKSTGRLTQRDIDALTPQPGAQYVAWDKSVPGFGVRISPAGAKAFVLKFRLKSGRVRWKTIGRVDDLSLAEARDRAVDDRGLVARGQDPCADTDRARGAVTVAEAADRFLKEYAIERSKSTQRNYKAAVDAHIRPWLGSIPIVDLTLADVEKLHHRLRATPTQANRVIAALSKCCAWHRIEPNPCKGVRFYTEEKRTRYLSVDEYAQLGKALRDGRKAGAYASAALTAIELLLLTGCRPAEVASLQWSFVDLKRGVIQLPASKTGAKPVFLSIDAVQLLKRWPRFAESLYVFPGTGRRQRGEHMHPSTLTHTFQSIREAAGLPDDLRLYDACRHSYASVALTDHGMSLAQIGEQLGHKQSQTTARYAHLHDSAARENANAIGGTIAAALKRRVRR